MIPFSKYFPLCIMTLFAVHGAGDLEAQPVVVDRIVAVVGREPILLSDLNAQAEFYALNNRVDPGTPGVLLQVLDAMINEKLILASALEDTNITVREDDV